MKVRPRPAARARAAIVGVLAPVVLVGCATSTRPPAVDVTGVELRDVTEEGFVVDVLLRLQNPNNAPLQLTVFRYALGVEGREVYDGRWSAEATLSAGGESATVVPAVVRFDRLPPALGAGPGALPEAFAYRLEGELEYLAPGTLSEILFDAGVRRPSVDFASRGRLELDAAPAPEPTAIPEPVEPGPDVPSP